MEKTDSLTEEAPPYPIVIVVKLVQPLNALEPNVVILVPTVILDNPVQLANVESPIDVTLFPNVKLDN